MVSIAVSFLVMIIAVSVSSGFRKEIRSGVASFCGDIQLTSLDADYLDEKSSISARPSYYERLKSVSGVESISGAVYRAGIVKTGDNIQGVLFKGVSARDSLSGLLVDIPSRLSEILSLDRGDSFTAYFVGERVKARRFTVNDIYELPVEADDYLMVFAALEDMQRLNDWDSTRVSALEVSLSPEYRRTPLMKEIKEELGTIALMEASDNDEVLLSTSVMDRYRSLFDWLTLIDFNVVFILLLMTVVAGFNMISGLLILLFRSISTIGMLKSMGMTDRSIAEVFLRVSSNLVLKGMAIGNGLALIFCAVQSRTHFLKLNPENYFVSFVPVSADIPMILLADIAAYVGIILLLLIPCTFISRIDPATTVRAQ